MSPAHRRFLLVEQGIGAGIFNFVLNGVIAWAMFRHQDAVPLWGQQSIAGDTIGTSLILPLMTCLIVTPLARKSVRDGKVPVLDWTRASHPGLGWMPARTFLRALAFGLICLLLLSPLTITVLTALHVAELRLWPFVLFKASFAAFEAALVTPVIALWAIAGAGLAAAPARS